MSYRYGNSLFFKRLFQCLLIVILVVGPAQLLANTFSLGDHRVLAASDPVIAAAGDIACDPGESGFNNGNGTATQCQQLATSNLLVNAGLDAVLALGDTQYACGSNQAFLTAYDLSWGKVKSITHPAVGNHEYTTSGGTGCDATNSGAAGYFNYFGSAAGSAGQGYYSFDIGAWHLISLNSQCSQVGGCSSSSPQYKWLQSDLAAHPNQCLLAYWHIPLFSSAGNAASNSQPFWNLLYSYHTDLILNGHAHIYERYGLQNPSAVADPNGIREIIVGTGGKSHYAITTVAANSEVQNTSTYGVLKLTLHSTSYEWQFVPIPGQTFTDSGTTSCHSAGTASTATPIATPTTASTGTLAVTSTSTSTPTSTGTLAVTSTSTSTPTSTDTLAVTSTSTFTPTTGTTTTSTPTPTPIFTPTSSGSSQISFTPTADSYVSSANPTINYGTSTTLRADGSPTVNTYIRFTVSGLTGPVTHASLSLFANSGGIQGIQAYSVADNTWGETTITYNNVPALGSLLASSGTFATGTRVTLDVSSYITGNGTYSLRVTNLSSTAVSFAARESGANAPQLILGLGSGGGPTPSVTPTNTPTFTSTQSVTGTSTPAISITPTNSPTFTNTSAGTTPFTPTSTQVKTPTATTTASATQSFPFAVAADAYVDSSNPTVNFGTASTIRVDGSPAVNSYLQFNVVGLSGAVIKATLRIHANSSGSLGIKVDSVANNTWGETTITYSTAPPLGNVLASSAAFTSGTWISVDVTNYITGNGTYSFGITDPSATAISLASRESGANSAQLIVDTQ